MERELFSGQDIKGLSGWTRVKLDVTNSDANSKAVLKDLNLFGPPALIFYKQGQEAGRVVGETKADELEQTLAKL
jgi:thiol:disulfide interchange protein DsbD